MGHHVTAVAMIKMLGASPPTRYTCRTHGLRRRFHMGSFSAAHWLMVLLVVLLLFGAGKIPRLMGDLAKGIKTFKTSMNEDEQPGGLETKAGPNDRKPAA